METLIHRGKQFSQTYTLTMVGKAMAKDKYNMFGCPACGYRVSSGEEACPRCGNSFNTATRFECPFCGELVDRGVKSCPACHVNYAEFKEKTEARGGDDSIDSLLLDIIKLESVSIKHDDKKFGCPKCSWLLDGSEEKCPKCGEIFSSDVSFQCPICGSSVTPNSLRCPECGIVFGEEEEARASQHEGAESSLDEIAAAAAETHSPSTEYTPQEADESGHGRERENVSAVTDKISSIFDKIADAVKVDSKPQPPPSPPRKEKPVEEIAEEPEPTPAAPAGDLSTEEESREAEVEPETPSAPEPPKKPKTRKLKAKPQGAKSK